MIRDDGMILPVMGPSLYIIDVCKIKINVISRLHVYVPGPSWMKMYVDLSPVCKARQN